MNTVQETCYMRQQSLQLTIFMLTFDFPIFQLSQLLQQKKQNDHKIHTL